MAEHAPYEQYIELEALVRLWPEEADDTVLACGLQSIELLFSLLRDAVDDFRPPSLTGKRAERMVDLIAACLRETAAPYVAGAHRPTIANELPESLTTNAEVVACLPDNLRTRLQFAHDEHFSPLPFVTGLEHYLSPPAVHNTTQPAIDYSNLVRVAELRAIRRRNPHGPEDVLFATVHQTVECWLRIIHHHMATAELQCRAGDWSGSARSVAWAARAMTVATDCARLLDLMVLHDYHPLRVRLRDGSGAQSRAAQRLPNIGRTMYQAFQQQLDERGLSVLNVLLTPDVHLQAHQLQAELQDFGRRCQTFLFEHYLLACSVLGVNNLGSLGYPMHQLAKRAAHPFWPALDQAKHDYVIITNLEHAEHSGSIILANELRFLGRPLPVPRQEPCSPDTMMVAAQAYFSCLEKRDADGWVALFEPDGVLRDSERSRPYIGHPRLRLFIEQMLNTFSTLSLQGLSATVAGNELHVAWTLRGVSLGVEVTFSGREQFQFSAAGKLTDVLVDWDATQVSRTLREALAPAPAVDQSAGAVPHAGFHLSATA